jgi:hypothetical protein
MSSVKALEPLLKALALLAVFIDFGLGFIYAFAAVHSPVRLLYAVLAELWALGMLAIGLKLLDNKLTDKLLSCLFVGVLIFMAGHVAALAAYGLRDAVVWIIRAARG